MDDETLILARRDVQELLGYDECIAAVEDAFRRHAAGASLAPGVLAVKAPSGAFHVKAAGLRLGRTYFAAKTNANFPDNPRRRGRPAIQGVIVLCDADDGRPLALMDSMEVTLRRTAAATAVAARRLARPESATVAVCGCGQQGRAQLRALARVLPLRRVFAFDAEASAARAYAAEMSGELGLPVSAAASVDEAARDSDVVVTCTPARAPLLARRHVRPGTFVAAVGADSPEKRELEADLLAGATVVPDVLEQCAAIGELRHALAAGALARADVRGELADLVAGRVAGRTSAGEITVFDSTGTALEDVASAALVFERARERGLGLRVALGA
jgi:ornithine cyclodeaminase/alanine dehydrogenase-like protein (mu-crystallin family)